MEHQIATEPTIAASISCWFSVSKTPGRESDVIGGCWGGESAPGLRIESMFRLMGYHSVSLVREPILIYYPGPNTLPCGSALKSMYRHYGEYSAGQRAANTSRREGTSSNSNA